MATFENGTSFVVVFVCLAFWRYESGCIHFGDIVFEADTMRKQLTELANGLKEVAKKIAPENKVGLRLKMSAESEQLSCFFLTLNQTHNL